MFDPERTRDERPTVVRAWRHLLPGVALFPVFSGYALVSHRCQCLLQTNKT